MRHQVLTVFALFSLLVGQNVDQQALELDNLDRKLVQHFEKRMPEWKHERVEPIAGSGKNVLIQFWSFSNRKVKVSILLHDSVEKARAVIQHHARYSFNSERLTGIGDEAYSSAYASSLVAFRRGKLTVYVSAGFDADLYAATMTLSQRLELEKAEVKRLSRELAKQVVDGIDAP